MLSKKWFIFIAIIVIVLYAHTLHFPHLLYWDNANFSYTHHPIIQQLNINNLLSYFTQSFDNHYHPLTLISLSVDYSLGHGKSIYFRLTNLILYIGIVLFLFVFIFKLLKNSKAALFITLFYAIHPFNVESVVWISERKNLLFMFFLLPSLIYYMRYIEESKWKYIGISCFFFLLSLLSKSQGLPLVGILFIVDFIKQRSLSKNLILEKLPYLVIATIFLLLMFYFHVPENFVRTHPHQFSDYFFSGFRNMFFYIYKTFIPFNFSPFYPYPKNPTVSYWYFPLLFILILFLLLKYFKTNRLFIAGFAFYIISIFPLLKFFSIPYGNYIAADRHMILPLIGLSIATWSILESQVNKPLIKYSYYAFLLILSISTYYYSLQWQDSKRFYSYLIKQYPEVISGWGNRGRLFLKEHKYKYAIQDFKQALKLKSDNSNLNINLGLAYVHLNQFDSAYFYFSEAIRCDSSNFKAYSNRALTLIKLNKPNEALIDITSCVILQPDFAEGWFNKALIEYRLHYYQQAIESLKQSRKLKMDERQIILLEEQIISEMKKLNHSSFY